MNTKWTKQRPAEPEAENGEIVVEVESQHLFTAIGKFRARGVEPQFTRIPGSTRWKISGSGWGPDPVRSDGDSLGTFDRPSRLGGLE